MKQKHYDVELNAKLQKLSDTGGMFIVNICGVQALLLLLRFLR